MLFLKFKIQFILIAEMGLLCTKQVQMLSLQISL